MDGHYLIAMLRDRDGLAFAAGSTEDTVSFKKLRDNLVEIIDRYESKGMVMPSCINDLKDFFDMIEMPNFEQTIGDDPDTPCWKYALDGGFDSVPDLKDAYEELISEIKGFRM